MCGEEKEESKERREPERGGGRIQNPAWPRSSNG
jgi:hypothetical protein